MDEQIVPFQLGPDRSEYAQADFRSESKRCLVSIVVPVFNEVENVSLLCQEISQAMTLQGRDYEVVLVDDGSQDGTVEELHRLAMLDRRIKLVLLRRNFGQTAAMQAGIDFAQGKFLVTLDGDLQNDPADIPMMLDQLDEGYDLVHGWRRDRQDDLLSRKVPSTVANWLISRVTGFPIHDLGCTLKAMRSEIAEELELYGEMHRFIPILAHQIGAKSLEVVTHHRARQFGTTKYGIGRTSRVLFDLMTVKFMLSYFSSPMKLFGKLGAMVAGIGLLSTGAAIAMKLLGGFDLTGNPMLMLGIMAVLLSVQFFSLGLIGEVCARIYYSHERKSNYKVRRTVNLNDNTESAMKAQERDLRSCA